jgi:hypothetical protein
VPFIQRNSVSLNNVVYTTGRYENPNWIVSLSPSKVGSGTSQWNASHIQSYFVDPNDIRSGEYLFFTGSGWKTLPASGGGSGVSFTADSGVVLSDSILKMGGTGQLTLLNFEEDPFNYKHSGIIIKDSLNGFYNLENVFLGTETQNDSESSRNVAIGPYSLSYASGDRNIAIGVNSLQFNYSEDCIAIGQDVLSSTVGFSYYNIGIGSYAINSSTSVGNLIAVGESAFNSTTFSSHSTAVGNYAGALSSGVYKGLFLGEGAGSYSSGSGNVYIGSNAGAYTIGSNNIEILTTENGLLSGVHSKKINIGNFIVGNSQSKRISIGQLNESNLNPSGTIHVIPSAFSQQEAVLYITPSVSFSHNFALFEDVNSKYFLVDRYGLVSGVSASFSSGIKIDSGIPSLTSQVLYSSGSTLYWNGSPVGSGGGSGVEYFADSGVQLVGDTFIMGGTGIIDHLTINEKIKFVPSGGIFIHSDFLDPSGRNIFIGPDQYTSDSHDNIAVGIDALNQTSGIFNIAIGDKALYGSDGTYEDGGLYVFDYVQGNIAIGRESASLASDFGNAVSIGNSAMLESSGAYNAIAIGTSAMYGSKNSAGTVAIGDSAGFNTVSPNSVFIGRIAGFGSSGDGNIYFGPTAGFGITGSGNIEIVNGLSNGIFDPFTTTSHKLNFNRLIMGDFSSKRISIGDLSVSHLSPSATLELIPQNPTDKVLVIKSTSSQTANLLEAQDSFYQGVFSVSPVGLVSGVSLVSSGGVKLDSGVPSSTSNKLYANGDTLFWNGSPVGSGGGGSETSLSGAPSGVSYFSSSSEISSDSNFKYSSSGKFLEFLGTGISANPIRMNILPNSTLSFEGTEGQLLKIEDNLSSGTIFAVSDISGMPSIEVDASGLVKFAEYDGYVGIGTSQTFGQYSSKVEITSPSGVGGLAIRPSSGSSSHLLTFQNFNSGILSIVDASGRFSIGGTGSTNQLEIKPLSATTRGLLVQGGVSQSANLMEVQNSSSSGLFAVMSNGAISGALSPTVVSSAGMTLTDWHHGKIIEHTGVTNGTYTIGSITIPSWQCMLVNFASGITVASGTNVLRSFGGFRNISDLYGSASMYRRPNGEFFLYGSIA